MVLSKAAEIVILKFNIDLEIIPMDAENHLLETNDTNTIEVMMPTRKSRRLSKEPPIVPMSVQVSLIIM